MKRKGNSLTGIAGTAVLLAGLSMSSVVSADGHGKMIEEGKRLAFDRKLGNCLACHMIAGGELAGNIGPPLIAMKARFPDRSKLREQIYDATIRNPHSMMPPFGRHKALTEKQIDLITDFIHTL